MSTSAARVVAASTAIALCAGIISATTLASSADASGPVASVAISDSSSPTPSSTPSASPTTTPSPTSTASPITPVPSLTPTASPTPTVTPTASPAPTVATTTTKVVTQSVRVVGLIIPFRYGTAAYSKYYARYLMKRKYHWGRVSYSCLVRLWDRESHWNRFSHNSSGAHGIPQALPGHKMRSMGRDWRNNPRTQIRWGLAYIKGKYGNPCRAWRFWRSHHWY